MDRLKDTHSERTDSKNEIQIHNAKDESKKNELDTCNLEDALQVTGVGRYSYALFAIGTYSLISAVMETFGVGFIVTTSQCDLELDLYKKGLIGSLPMLGIITSAPIWGYVADTRGRKFALNITMGGTFLMGTVSSLSFHWIFMAFSKFFSALFASGTIAVIYTLIGESIPGSHRSRFLLYVTSCCMFSHVFMAVIGYLVLRLKFSLVLGPGFTYRPWRLLAQAFGLMSGINLLLLLVFIYESPKFYISKGKDKEGLEVLARIFGINFGKKPEQYPVNKIIFDEDNASRVQRNFFKSIWSQTIPLMMKPYLKNTLLMFYTSTLVYSIAPAVVIWLPDILNSYINHMDRVDNEIFCSIIQKPDDLSSNATTTLTETCDDQVNDLTLGFMGGNGIYLFLLCGAIAAIVNYIGKRWTFVGVHVICGLTAFLLDYIKNIASVFLLFITISNGACMSITTAYAVELFPTYLRATAVCLTMMVGRMFSFIVINLIGPLIKTNCSLLFNAMGFFILTGAVVGYFLPSDKKQPQKEMAK